jgi:peptidyl-prolyl cis-trans isomerase D
LTGLEEYNQAFFDKIDLIENKISKDIDFKTIINELNIIPIIKKNYLNIDNKKTIENSIYNSRKDKIAILEDKNSYIFYNIDNIINKLPDLKNNKFKKQIRNLLSEKEKFEFNKKLLEQIDKKEFNQNSFDKLSNNQVQKIKLNSIENNQKFEKNSIEILFSLPINTFALVVDDKDNVFVAKTIKYEEQNISENSNDFNDISNQASAENRNSILKSYDYLLNNKYKVVINEKTLDRVKNYFR